MSIEPNVPRQNILLVKDMNPMARNFDCEVIVLQKDDEPVVTRENELIFKFLVADRTGSINLTVWGEMGASIKIGDILRITGNSLKIKRIGQDTFIFVEKPNMSEADFSSPNTMQFNRSKNQPPSQYQAPQPPQQSQTRNNYRQRGYSNHPHPYNNRGRGQHYMRGNRGGRGGEGN
ncbi:hypothetical protein BD560DRAFT_332626 [Blakeslea trispora]|nr:hypothetical protein BD560DRAFT_332626 [Blakeslea trispora]